MFNSSGTIIQRTFVFFIRDQSTDGVGCLADGACDLGESQHAVEDVFHEELLGATPVVVQVCRWDEAYNMYIHRCITCRGSHGLVQFHMKGNHVLSRTW